ncbi:excinuclease ABC subunit A [Aggregicoccus sp. 17bor-14]|uniref:excinuclease ABC subunit UvrA n=1 Tax=Myxococcaceae TaxID=31 RepID=UPI00129C5E3E|nr:MULTISPECIES: excinuclease ABC subunit UvrA [Myxococcaceae]MBF5044815.1 excinuclease ABC subunit UvrA [Simulacricoccus sp. 17bor-14]MRI90559.1 excinuclease ABC subunit A [Aggregicoccus sp. 17bor-14]
MHKTHLVGARTHNLRSVSIDLQEGELVCITGVSGAGKSSLALDTLYAEGQRRFVESFSPYARQFLERLERPPMDALEPVAAGVAVDRRAPVKSSRSTVATLADVEAYLSALFTREAVPVCPDCGLEARRTDARVAAEALLKQHAGAAVILAHPMRIADTAHFLEVRAQLLREGYRRLVVRGEVRELEELRPSEAADAAGIAQVVLDRVKLGPDALSRVTAAVEEGWRRTDGEATAFLQGASVPVRLRRGLVCPGCAREFEPARPGLFSYQSPTGACATCRGFGRTIGIDWAKVTPNPGLSLAGGAIRPWTGKSTEWERSTMLRFAQKRGVPTDVPWGKLSEGQRELILEGEGRYEGGRYPGVRAWFKWMEGRTYKMHVRVLLSRYRSYDKCETCHGARLNAQALAYRVGGLDLAAWHGLELADARARLETLKTATGQGELARKELAARLGYLERVGLGYLTLDRPARTLSGGEAQRVSLTAALGTSLTGALFVLDEPTVGLHPSDVVPLGAAMEELAARGNVALVIEQDPQIIRAAHRVLELGPGAGAHGGQLVFDGTPEQLAKREDLPTGRFLAGGPAAPRAARKRSSELHIRGARENNLRTLDVRIPLGVLCVITGPSGSGKSTLMDEVLHRHVALALGEKDVEAPGAVDAVEGVDALEGVTFVDQAPLGRTSRGNAATYTKAWDRLRERFAAEPDAELRGLTAAHFSFNVDKGRCEACSGEGYETVEMQFLADVALRCAVCRGRRFKEEVLAVRHAGLSVAQLLELTVSEVLERFADDAALKRTLGPVAELGLGYLPLGQPLTTLSGGEAQRLKLARALSSEPAGTLFLIDEPSAGLHDADVAHVMGALHRLVERGASVVVVDHDLAVMRGADWIIDLGPGGGRNGGTLVAEGPPAQLMKGPGLTAEALRNDGAPRKKAPARAKPAELPRAIRVEHAREHNLRDVSTDIPLGKMTVVTGPSGSGKSTLAFDVVFAEGQRRFLETLTPYARQFLPTMPRPDVERISGIPPTVALEQRTSRAGATSTVATVTEVSHYLRLLYAKLGQSHCPRDDSPIAATTPDAMYAQLTGMKGEGVLLAPAVRARKGTYLDLFAAAAKGGVLQAWVDGQLASTDDPPRLAKTKEHDIDLVLYEGRLSQLPRDTFERALNWGKGALKVRCKGKEDTLLSSERTCPKCGLAVPELDPRWFSFNTQQGACEACGGTGVQGGAEAQSEGVTTPCRTCEGTRLAPVPRAVRLEGARYHEVVQPSVSAALARVRGWKFKGDRGLIGEASRQELLRRLEFLERVGLGYLSLDRAASTLSGGEMQRLRLSAQLGAGLTGALYVLDEPTIGLHPRDTHRLLENLRALVSTGSTVLVVEHDSDTIRAADHVIDIGPTGGRGGGRILAQGTPEAVLADEQSPTARALRAPLVLPAEGRGVPERWIELKGARANNLKNVDLRLPVGRLTAVSGVSGSGKSTLIRQVLYPAMREALGLVAGKPGPFDRLVGADAVKRVLAVDQSPIGRTPRSVPATFLGIWDELRRVFAATPEAKLRGFGPTRFSFNSAQGGRCPACEGQGAISHEMAFLPDVVTPCEVCGGARFDAATLEVRYHGLSIGDALRLSADEAKDVFAALPKVAAPLANISDLGVGYLQLGQGSNTLSGGEAQRLKLAAELTATRFHEPTLYVLDEPTTGLHLGDVARLIAFMKRLVDRGDTLVVIEHHPAVIAAADHVVELGPEGGDGGGLICAEGTPHEVARRKTATGKVLKALFEAEGLPRRRGTG